MQHLYFFNQKMTRRLSAPKRAKYYILWLGENFELRLLTLVPELLMKMQILSPHIQRVHGKTVVSHCYIVSAD